MSRWCNGNWAMAAVAIDDSGDIYPLSEISLRCGLKVEGFYEEKGWYQSTYYALDDVTGSWDNRYEGSFDIIAHLRITDRSGVTVTREVSCEGYTCCGEDCYMLLSVTTGTGAEDAEVAFDAVDEVEIIEAIGKARFDAWRYGDDSDDPREIDGPLF